MQKIIIKHLAGSKSNQIETFALPIQEMVFGRENACQVIFDPEKDDLVSRKHCKITVQNENQFFLTDLDSRNGTFVNNAKITSPQQLYAGDVVQLGKGGPQFTFDLDPRPQSAPKATRLGEAAPTVAATRETRIDPVPGAATASNPEQSQTKTSTFDSSKPVSVGRNTVERLITQAETNSRKKMINIGAGIIGLIVAVSGYFGFQNYQGKAELENTVIQQIDKENEKKIAELKASQGLTAADIFKKSGNSTVLVEMSWKLIHIPTGKQLFQREVCTKTQRGKCAPVYKYYNGVVEPELAVDGVPIGGAGSGSGFVVNENGFILTNRHVAASWQTSYDTFKPGILKVCLDADCSRHKQLWLDENNSLFASLGKWVPSQAIYKPLHGKSVEGRHDYLDVTFPKTGLRIPARLVRTSDTADVALIKIDVPESMQPVEMGSDDTVSAGDNITVMGYPGISPDIKVKMNSQDPFNREGEVRQIPEPTVTGGNIGKVIQGSAATVSDSVNSYHSDMGDVYQLTVNATGSGNSGGPVFNDKGHVIGIFTYGSFKSGTAISFAVPIKHGQEIMGIHKLVQ